MKAYDDSPRFGIENANKNMLRKKLRSAFR
jgi:hypothetical protein